MLKIKDNVDLKELENYGFRLVHYVNQDIYALDEKHENWNFRICEDRIIIFNQLSVDNKLPVVIYDLIKADLVEKVDDK